MSYLDPLRESLIMALDEEEKVRDEAFLLSRELIRSCRKLISDLVLEKEIDPGGLRNDVRKMTRPSNRESVKLLFVEDALAEYCEVEILRAFMLDERIPDPGSLGVPERAYVLGLCDVVGELRRVALNRLLRSDTEGAVAVYEKMKEVGHLIEGLVYPSGMIPLKKKQDVVRSLLDRTGGELAVALHSHDRRLVLGGGPDDG